MRCSRGHVLFDPVILANTTAGSFSDGFWLGLLYFFLVSFVLYLFSRIVPEKRMQDIYSIFLFVVAPLLALLAFLRGRRWRAQGGAVMRLAPRAYGIAAGWLAFMVFIILLFAVVLRVRGH